MAGAGGVGGCSLWPLDTDEAVVEYPRTSSNISLHRRCKRGGPPFGPKAAGGTTFVHAGRWYDVDYSFSGGRVVERVAFERMVIVERRQSRVRRI